MDQNIGDNSRIERWFIFWNSVLGLPYNEKPEGGAETAPPFFIIMLAYGIDLLTPDKVNIILWIEKPSIGGV